MEIKNNTDIEKTKMENYKVILVDDEEEVIDAIKSRILWEQLGLQIVGSATNGVKALELVEKLQPDIVITDIKMPYMNGLELSRRLNDEYREVKNGWNTTKALKAGIGLLPEDRKTQGFMNLSNNYENIAISSLEKYMTGPFTDTKKKIKNAEVYFEEMDVHPRRVDYMTSNMSGGNQQKVILARWMSTDVDIIIFDEPTKGVDVGAKAEIYRLMEQLVEDGKSIIVVSSELPEALVISDRMIIMSEG